MAVEYKITKILSNNVVITEMESKLYVLIGKGIGFGKKTGSFVVDEREIEQRFAAIEGEDKENYTRILKDVEREIVAVSEEIIALASQKVGDGLNSHIHVGLTDHIDFAIKRQREGIDIANPFLFEIEAMYPEEYSIARSALDLIDRRLMVKLPESEAGFIALHIHSARVRQSVGESLKYTSLVKEIIRFIEKETGVPIGERSLDYGRLISHLKYALYRIESGKVLKNILLSSVKRQLKYEYKLAKKVCELISNKLEKEVPEDEVGYIAIHLGRLKSVIDNR